MEKDQNQKPEVKNPDENETNQSVEQVDDKNNSETETSPEISPEEKILELEDKLARTFAEMENQRRRFEKEREEAYEYGGFVFAKESLNLIDNLERSKKILEDDENLKNSNALKKPWNILTLYIKI